MREVSIFFFLPVTVLLLVISFSERLRSRLLSIKWVAAAEKGLGGLNRLYWLAFVLIMAAGVFVRCYRFVELPIGINQDGLMAGVEGYCLMRDGTDQYGTSWPTYFKAWGFSQMSTLYSYLLIPFLRFLGLSKFTLRLPMLLVSLAMLPVVWDFARRMAGKGFALLALLVVATNPWQMIQSRWALEANLMPHVLLMGMYLLFIGRRKRWALYLSMVFFGLTPYAYGVACFSVPVLLVFAAVYYLARKKANVLDLLVCVLIFVAVAGPYFYTMAINAFGWETATLGPITMPRFEDSLRSNDMAFSQENPYFTMLWNLLAHLRIWLLGSDEAVYSVVDWTQGFYLFAPPVTLAGVYLLWKNRRKLAAQGEDSPVRDGGMLLLLWMLASLFNGLMIGGVLNRNNAVCYAVIFLIADAFDQMGKKLRLGLAVMLSMLLVSFAGFGVTYFTDEDYQDSVGTLFHQGLSEALSDTWDWDYDRYYVRIADEKAHKTFMTAAVMFDHKIDYSARNEDTDMTGPDGQPTDWYFTERYVFTDYADFEPDPMECAVYIMVESDEELFPEEHFLLVDYGEMTVAYPKYWAE